MRIVLLGAPGAGKGTQCKWIAEKYALEHLSSGDILRRERAECSGLGQKAQQYMDSGELVPDELIVEMMAGAISETPPGGFVLDGFPRTIKQAVSLDESLAAVGKKIDAVINLEIDDEKIVERMVGRRSCPQCGGVYHVENLKPKVEGVCDKDGAELIQRPDDTPEVVSNRLETYHRQTEPVVDYYKQQNIVYNIDANEEADEVTELIFDKLNVFVPA